MIDNTHRSQKISSMGHSFHIPVMGTGFSIDTPLKVARFGIASVVSLVDDQLIEKIRRHYCQVFGESYQPIRIAGPEGRAARIREYLNSLQRWIDSQMNAMRLGSFGQGGDLDLYFELLDPCSEMSIRYAHMKREPDERLRYEMQKVLRQNLVSGSVDVNLMTKVDKEPYPKTEKLEDSDALTALRGFAESELSSAVVFSAGVNLRLFR